jgi:hypothetical protein
VTFSRGIGVRGIAFVVLVVVAAANIGCTTTQKRISGAAAGGGAKALPSEARSEPASARSRARS